MRHMSFILFRDSTLLEQIGDLNNWANLSIIQAVVDSEDEPRTHSAWQHSLMRWWKQSQDNTHLHLDQVLWCEIYILTQTLDTFLFPQRLSLMTACQILSKSSLKLNLYINVGRQLVNFEIWAIFSSITCLLSRKCAQCTLKGKCFSVKIVK